MDSNQARAQQTLLMIRTVRNNLFHGGKYLPVKEVEEGRNEQLVSCSLIVLNFCIALNREVQHNYEV